MAKLSDLQIDEVSLVRKGANQHSKVVIAKSGEPEGDEVAYFDEDGNPVDLETLDFGNHVYDDEGNEFEWLEADDDAVQAEVEELEPVGKSAFSRSGKPKQSTVAKGASFVDSLRVQLSKALTDEDRDEVISKALDQVATLEEIAKAAQETALEEREARRFGEFMEFAKSYSLPVDDTDLARVMMHAEDALPIEDVELIAKCFQAASEAIFSEQGNVGGGDNDDIMARVNAATESVFSKSRDTSREQLTSQAFENNPDLYSEWTREHYGYTHGR